MHSVLLKRGDKRVSFRFLHTDSVGFEAWKRITMETVRHPLQRDGTKCQDLSGVSQYTTAYKILISATILAAVLHT